MFIIKFLMFYFTFCGCRTASQEKGDIRHPPTASLYPDNISVDFSSKGSQNRRKVWSAAALRNGGKTGK
ncbi:MAG: hypothetical protein DBX58_02865 [Clostridiales bacterium]|nr:MAG: hypothetical protein DBX58_02865 [Clostridiales bacterium]